MRIALRRRWPLTLLGITWAMSLTASALAATTGRKPGGGSGRWQATATWAVAQLIPSPLLAISDSGASGGMRWQWTPLVYSFGVTEDPWRSTIVSPVARHTGAFELYVSPEWYCCVRASESGWLGRAGARIYFPVVGHGEALTTSVGGSYYYENRRHGGAAELGLYGLSSLLGATVTFAPRLIGREIVVGLSLHLY